jgi:hypothetical protein
VPIKFLRLIKVLVQCNHQCRRWACRYQPSNKNRCKHWFVNPVWSIPLGTILMKCWEQQTTWITFTISRIIFQQIRIALFVNDFRGIKIDAVMNVTQHIQPTKIWHDWLREQYCFMLIQILVYTSISFLSVPDMEPNFHSSRFFWLATKVHNHAITYCNYRNKTCNIQTLLSSTGSFCNDWICKTRFSRNFFLNWNVHVNFVYTGLRAY